MGEGGELNFLNFMNGPFVLKFEQHFAEQYSFLVEISTQPSDIQEAKIYFD